MGLIEWLVVIWCVAAVAMLIHDLRVRARVREVCRNFDKIVARIKEMP